MLPIPGTPEEAELLQAALVKGGLTTAGLAGAYGLDHGDRAVLLGPRSYLAPSVGDALLRLWFAGEPVLADDVADIVGPLPVGRLEELGLLSEEGGLVTSTVRIMPVGGSWFVGDQATEHVGDLPADHVLGPTASALTLLHLTIRRPGRAALDIGTGCGVHAILAAEHHEVVVATDISERALSLGRWAAWLNDVRNIEWRLGDLYEPAIDETFDLVVSSPPFVITPDVTSTFRDGGMEGDEFSRAVAVGAAGHLAPGGTATVLANWGCSPDEDDAERPIAWMAGAGCHALALVHRVESGVHYASRWAEPVAATPEEHRALTARWAQTYQAAGWDRVASGALILHRPARDGTSTWALGLETPSSGLGPAGPELAAIIERRDLLGDGMSDELVFDTAGFVVEQSFGPVSGGGLRLTAVSVRLGGGLPFQVNLDRIGLALIERVDGWRTVADLVTAIADDLHVDVEAVSARVQELLPELVTLGFLVPSA